VLVPVKTNRPNMQTDSIGEHLMLMIRSEQMNTFAEFSEVRFIEEMTTILKSEFPEAQEIPSQELQEMIRRQMANSIEYGLETEQQAAAYIITVWLMDDDFDTSFKEVHETLQNGSVLPSTLERSTS
jgi:hypothetical protein